MLYPTEEKKTEWMFSRENSIDAGMFATSQEFAIDIIDYRNSLNRWVKSNIFDIYFVR